MVGMLIYVQLTNSCPGSHLNDLSNPLHFDGQGSRNLQTGEAMNSAQRFMECRERNAVSFDFREMDRLYYRVNDQIGLLEWDHVIALLCHNEF
jgi:hypothetical protein